MIFLIDSKSTRTPLIFKSLIKVSYQIGPTYFEYIYMITPWQYVRYDEEKERQFHVYVITNVEVTQQHQQQQQFDVNLSMLALPCPRTQDHSITTLPMPYFIIIDNSHEFLAYVGMISANMWVLLYILILFFSFSFPLLWLWSSCLE